MATREQQNKTRKAAAMAANKNGTITDCLRAALLEQGATPTQIANRTGIDRAVASRFLSGHPLSGAALNVLCREYGYRLSPIDPSNATKATPLVDRTLLVNAIVAEIIANGGGKLSAPVTIAGESIIATLNLQRPDVGRVAGESEQF